LEKSEQSVLDTVAKSKTHRVKTDRLAENHYKRVTNFAKEMLVWPDEISVHKNRNPTFIDHVKPATVVPLIPLFKQNTETRNSIDYNIMKGAVTTS